MGSAVCDTVYGVAYGEKTDGVVRGVRHLSQNYVTEFVTEFFAQNVAQCVAQCVA